MFTPPVQSCDDIFEPPRPAEIAQFAVLPGRHDRVKFARRGDVDAPAPPVVGFNIDASTAARLLLDRRDCNVLFSNRDGLVLGHYRPD
jgi:hypothetical protein